MSKNTKKIFLKNGNIFQQKKFLNNHGRMGVPKDGNFLKRFLLVFIIQSLTVVFKILIMAHRCQIYNNLKKNICARTPKQQRGYQNEIHVPSFFLFDFIPNSSFLYKCQLELFIQQGLLLYTVYLYINLHCH